MANNVGTEHFKLVVGLGKTGLSCARYFAMRGEHFKVVDSRSNPPGLAELRAELPQIVVELGEFSEEIFCRASELVVSPGISLTTPAIVKARAAGVPISGDIDIFSKAVAAPIIAVTGSNGKSTVVSLVAGICAQAKINFGLGGNLDGVQAKPVLDFLREVPRDLYILEVSSFQLETTANLGAEVAVLLNLSEDHMDRYDSLDFYLKAKQRIFLGCKQVVVNTDSRLSAPPSNIQGKCWEYGTGPPGIESFGLISDGAKEYLAFGATKLLAVDELKVFGQHNTSNVLAAMAIAHAVGIGMKPICSAVKEFRGLPNRCQWVANIDGVDFYNDSKGTNVGATIAAVEGLAGKIAGEIILIAGGVGKGADFRPLAQVLKTRVREVMLIGRDASQIAKVLDKEAQVYFAGDMEDAVRTALSHARPGDAVLLSPACASFDMYRDFQHRGQVFTDVVRSIH